MATAGRRAVPPTVRIRAVTWREVEGLRSAVLGWPPGAVPGDDDPSAQHVACVDGNDEPVASVSFMPHPRPDRSGERAVYLWALAVLPEHQRQGLGTRLLQAAVHDARERGATVLWADARTDAVPFYQRAGAVTQGQPYRDDVTGLLDRRIVLDLL